VISRFIFDMNGKIKREITYESDHAAENGQPFFQPGFKNTKIIELAKNKFGFSASTLTKEFKVYESTGKLIWAYGKKQIELLKNENKQGNDEKFVLHGAVGDLDNDGFAEYIVAIKNDGIRAFNHSGALLWHQPDNNPGSSLHIADIDGDGKNELLEIGETSRIRDASGKIKRELAERGWEAIPIPREDKNGRSLMTCEFSENKLNCIDENGKTTMEAAAPLIDLPKKNPQKITIPGHPENAYMDDREYAGFPKAVWVSFGKDQPKYLAAILSFVEFQRSNFYLYDEKGNLVYHELLPEGAKALAVMPAADGKQEIIVGGKNLWKYTRN
jgi:hypothetical protein